MKKRKRAHLRPYTEQQLAGLRASTSARKQATIERLRDAIERLKSKKQTITAQAIYLECGLQYSSYARNAEALALFRANSTHLVKKKKRARRKGDNDEVVTPVPRDSLMAYKKSQLVARLRDAEQQIQELKKQQSVLTDACLQRDAQVAELKALLADLEPYRSFIERMRVRIHQEERNG